MILLMLCSQAVFYAEDTNIHSGNADMIYLAVGLEKDL